MWVQTPAPPLVSCVIHTSFYYASEILCFLQIEGLWAWIKQVFQHHFSNNSCSVRVSGSYLGNSCSISNFFISIGLVTVIYNWWSLMLPLQLAEGSDDWLAFLAVKYTKLRYVHFHSLQYSCLENPIERGYMGSQRVGHNWAPENTHTKTHTHKHTHIYFLDIMLFHRLQYSVSIIFICTRRQKFCVTFFIAYSLYCCGLESNLQYLCSLPVFIRVDWDLLQ